MRSIMIVARPTPWRAALANRLHQDGYTVINVNDAEAALVTLSALSPGAILIDTTLPRKPCRRLLSRLDTEARLQGIRRLFVVASLYRSRGAQSGPVFETPVDPGHVARALHSLYPDTSRARPASPPRRDRDFWDKAIEAALTN